MKKCILIIFIAFALKVQAQFSVQDIRIGDIRVSYLDFEFWQQGNRFCFQDENNFGYVGVIDSLTGDLVSASGKDYLFDNTLAPITQSINGPEWGYRQGGADVFYTKQTGTNRSIGKATWNGVGYSISDLSSSLAGRRFATICSKNNADTSPNLVYAKGNNILNFSLNWSAANNPVSDIPVPYGANSSSGARFIDGEQALLTNDTANGYTQIFRYDLGSANLTQLTFDAGNKIDAFIWNAPDYDNTQLLYCTVNDTILRLYQKIGNTFNFVYDIQIPDTSYHYYFSAEPFVFQNKSYLFLCAATEKFIPGSQNNSKPADVWIVALDAARPYFRKVSDNRIALRLDPEVFITPTEAFIYYYEYYQNGNVHPVAMHKCSSGLGSAPLSTSNIQVKSLSLKIFPNPANSSINISSDKILNQISIYNLRGENILNLIPDKSEMTIDISNFSKGTYFIKATKGNISTTQKIIIQ